MKEDVKKKDFSLPLGEMRVWWLTSSPLVLARVIGLGALARRRLQRQCRPQLLVLTRRFMNHGARRHSVLKLRKRRVGSSANHDPMW